jgi:peptide chain release factor 3
MDELEKVLGSFLSRSIGRSERGRLPRVYNRKHKRIELFDRQKDDHGASMVKLKATDLQDERLADQIGSHHHEQLMNDIELLDIAGDDFDEKRILAGELTRSFSAARSPTSALSRFLMSFSAWLLRRHPETAIRERLIVLQLLQWFCFKIQANMNPDHRDRMAFIRICSGRFTKGLEALHQRTGRTVRLAQPQQFMAQDRNIVEEAYAGDIIGIFDPGNFRIGDSLTEGSQRSVLRIFLFSRRNISPGGTADSMKRKQFLKGIEQLAKRARSSCIKNLISYGNLYHRCCGRLAV